MPKDVSDIRFSSSSVDDFFSGPRPPAKVATGRIRVASVHSLAGFRVLSDDTLVRVSQQDFWKLGQDSDGYYIERLVSDDDGPVREV